jgi:transglutaminase superfamily protein
MFVARTGSTWVFLDLREDSYICLEPEYQAAMSRCLGLPPADSASDSGEADAEALEALLTEMIGAGMLTRDSGKGKAATLLDQPDDVRELLRYGVGGPKIRIRHIAAFLKAVLSAKWRLRFGHIETTVRHVAERRAKRRLPSVPQDSESSRELVEIFRKLRPLAMGRRDQCLLNSLALIEFLAAFGIFPAWHFGVRMNEFLAHCWVQEETTVYNDDVENVCDYTPIMRA